MTKSVFLPGISSLVLLFSCQSGKEMPLTTLIYDLEVDAFNDTVFFGNVNCLLAEGEDIYFTDHQNVRIMHLDKELHLQNIIGTSQGRGPQDLGYIEYFDVVGDTLWVGDAWKQAFVKFTTAGKFLDPVEQSHQRMRSVRD